MSDTPRTDEIVIGATAERLLSMCRKLERELAACQAENAILREQNLAMNATCVRYEQVELELPKIPIIRRFGWQTT